ncbi:hypothetical protein [Streptomyces phaeochromogenes]|uniref:hypothetical protein n=1 Tax=Streptomyces phaeochromogenes TaxID=1923 RepID=UPI00386D59F2|nr:hypothetical protein OG277_53380 [Streptomyces phaeochromogenes]
MGLTTAPARRSCPASMSEYAHFSSASALSTRASMSARHQMRTGIPNCLSYSARAMSSVSMEPRRGTAVPATEVSR